LSIGLPSPNYQFQPVKAHLLPVHISIKKKQHETKTLLSPFALTPDRKLQ
jgi:hypothetical protein